MSGRVLPRKAALSPRSGRRRIPTRYPERGRSYCHRWPEDQPWATNRPSPRTSTPS